VLPFSIITASLSADDFEGVIAAGIMQKIRAAHIADEGSTTGPRKCMHLHELISNELCEHLPTDMRDVLLDFPTDWHTNVRTERVTSKSLRALWAAYKNKRGDAFCANVNGRQAPWVDVFFLFLSLMLFVQIKSSIVQKQRVASNSQAHSVPKNMLASEYLKADTAEHKNSVFVLVTDHEMRLSRDGVPQDAIVVDHSDLHKLVGPHIATVNRLALESCETRASSSAAVKIGMQPIMAGYARKQLEESARAKPAESARAKPAESARAKPAESARSHRNTGKSAREAASMSEYEGARPSPLKRGRMK
jgi:hypothetical protein